MKFRVHKGFQADTEVNTLTTIIKLDFGFHLEFLIFYYPYVIIIFMKVKVVRL